MSITTSGSRSINVSPGANGIGTSISADSINVQTTCRAGYNLAVSTSVNDNNLYYGGDSANNTSGTYFSPASGSTALNNSPNTWGYYIDSTAPTDSSAFSAVPTLSSAAATLKTPVASEADINDSFNVYYGVSVANSMDTGTYKMIQDGDSHDGAIVYYLTMADACTSYTVHYSPTGADNNGTIRTGTGTVADQTIKEGVATALTTAKYTPPTVSGTTYYFQSWNTAQDGSGTTYLPGQSVTDLANVGETITLYAQWTDCPGGYVCYDSNGATGPTVNGNVAAMSNQSVSASATSISYLHAPNYYRTYYGFLGWSTTQLDPDDADFATDFANATAAGKVYGPMETVDITAGQYSSGGLRLYAVWLPKSTAYTMQTFGKTECTNNLTKITYATDANSNSGVKFTTENQPSITLDSFVALQDARDTNVYTVAKLTDGNCWMIDNLRLDNTNSDNATGSLAQGYGGTPGTYGSFVGLADPETANFSNSTTANTIYTSDGTNSIFDSANNTLMDIGTTNNPGYRMPRYNNQNTGSTVASSTGSNNTYGYGNYYTWAAVMANTNYYSGPTAQDANGKTSETVGTSICPKGWKLPYGRNTGNGVISGGFSYLDSQMGGTGTTQSAAAASNKWRQFPNNFLYSGYVVGSSVLTRGSYGYYWSSTANSNYNSYNLGLNSSYVYPGTYNYYKNNGFTARCLVGS